MKAYTFSLPAIILGIIFLGYYLLFIGTSGGNRGFDFGLDLAGGTQLTYEADISSLETTDVAGSIAALSSVLETRLNALGSSDIQVTTETASRFSKNSDQNYRVNIEIPGIFDVEEAKGMIGKIPLLEFRLERNLEDVNAAVEQFSLESGVSKEEILKNIDSYLLYAPTELTGRYIENAVLSSNPNSGQPTVSLVFNAEGAQIFADLTKENIGNAMAIFLDGQVISAPVIRSAILNGNAEISGQFTLDEATELVRNLKFGALPVPINLISTQSISPSLGLEIVYKGMQAGMWTFVFVSLILISLYQIGGLVATIALIVYSVILLSFFKVTGIDLTAAGIAGFIITIGMAVDANILIFERIKEELAIGKDTQNSVIDGFSRAWLSIRDGNLSSIIVAVILYFFTTSFIKGFALSFGIGVLVSMFTAIVVTRSILLTWPSDSPWIRRHLVGRIPKQKN